MASLYILFGGFVFCSIAAYFAGLVGSTNTPVSGLLVAALCILCMIILALFNMNGGIEGKATLGMILGIGSTVIIGAGIAIANDTMQDLKVGQMLGATPWKQQWMLILGVLIASTIVYIEAVLAEHLSYSTAMGILAGGVLFIGAIVILAGPEAKGIHFHPVEKEKEENVLIS